IVPGALKKLLTYIDRNPGSCDLLQGPIVWNELDKVSTHWSPEWADGMYGKWDLDQRGNDLDGLPFDIPLMGCGLFACRRDIWPGFNSAFRGFGGEEGYIHEKFRQRGGRTLCLPFLRWLHRFERPMGVPYTIEWADRIRNYMIGHHELGLPMEEMKAHFEEFLGEEFVTSVIRRVEEELVAHRV
ncbi:MAG: hypothetical protein ACR2PG_24900, partial [Hyphomicrobiaceae bacterium]